LKSTDCFSFFLIHVVLVHAGQRKILDFSSAKSENFKFYVHDTFSRKYLQELQQNCTSVSFILPSLPWGQRVERTYVDSHSIKTGTRV